MNIEVLPLWCPQGARYTIRSSLSGAVALAVPPALDGEPVTGTTTATTASTTAGSSGTTTGTTTAAACATQRWQNCRQSLC